MSSCSDAVFPLDGPLCATEMLIIAFHYSELCSRFGEAAISRDCHECQEVAQVFTHC
jgi:hypothetical protein